MEGRHVRGNFQRGTGKDTATFLKNVLQNGPFELDLFLLPILANDFRYLVAPVNPSPIRDGQDGSVLAILDLTERAGSFRSSANKSNSFL